MYNNRKVYLCNAINNNGYIFVFDIQQLITLLSNNIFNEIWRSLYQFYWELNIQNCIQICSDVTFVLYDV